MTCRSQVRVFAINNPSPLPLSPPPPLSPHHVDADGTTSALIAVRDELLRVTNGTLVMYLDCACYRRSTTESNGRDAASRPLVRVRHTHLADLPVQSPSRRGH